MAKGTRSLRHRIHARNMPSTDYLTEKYTKLQGSPLRDDVWKIGRSMMFMSELTSRHVHACNASFRRQPEQKYGFAQVWKRFAQISIFSRR